VIDISSDVTLECFLALLEFLYTMHSPIEDGDAVGILVLASRFNVPRLVSLCELYISKAVDVATRTKIANSDIDVIGLLMCAQLHNASQLAQFCLHFISTNYGPFTKRPEFSKLSPENLEYIEEHRWPPVSYLKALDDYEVLMKKKSQEREADDQPQQGTKNNEGVIMDWFRSFSSFGNKKKSTAQPIVA